MINKEAAILEAHAYGYIILGEARIIDAETIEFEASYMNMPCVCIVEVDGGRFMVRSRDTRHG